MGRNDDWRNLGDTEERIFVFVVVSRTNKTGRQVDRKEEESADQVDKERSEDAAEKTTKRKRNW